MRVLSRSRRGGRALWLGCGVSVLLALGVARAALAGGILGTDGVRYGGKDPSADAKGALVSSTATPGAPDVRRLRYRFGPIQVQPGQNLNELVGDGVPGPSRPGFITRFRFNLVNLDGTAPSVTDVHFHHGAWGTKGLLSSVLFLVGEEKSIASLPAGYGWPVRAGVAASRP